MDGSELEDDSENARRNSIITPTTNIDSPLGGQDILYASTNPELVVSSNQGVEFSTNQELEASSNQKLDVSSSKELELTSNTEALNESLTNEELESSSANHETESSSTNPEAESSSCESSTPSSSSTCKTKTLKIIPLSPQRQSESEQTDSPQKLCSFEDPRLVSGTYRASFDVSFELCKFTRGHRSRKHKSSTENSRIDSKKSHRKRRNSKSRSSERVELENQSPSKSRSHRNHHSPAKTLDSSVDSVNAESASQATEVSVGSITHGSSISSSIATLNSGQPSLEVLEELAQKLRNALQSDADNGAAAEVSDAESTDSFTHVLETETKNEDKVEAWVKCVQNQKILSPVKTPKCTPRSDPRLACKDSAPVIEITKETQLLSDRVLGTSETVECEKFVPKLKIKAEPGTEVCIKEEKTKCETPPPLPVSAPTVNAPPPLPLPVDEDSEEVVFIKTEPLDNMETCSTHELECEISQNEIQSNTLHVNTPNSVSSPVTKVLLTAPTPPIPPIPPTAPTEMPPTAPTQVSFAAAVAPTQVHTPICSTNASIPPLPPTKPVVSSANIPATPLAIPLPVPPQPPVLPSPRFIPDQHMQPPSLPASHFQHNGASPSTAAAIGAQHSPIGAHPSPIGAHPSHIGTHPSSSPGAGLSQPNLQSSSLNPPGMPPIGGLPNLPPGALSNLPPGGLSNIPPNLSQLFPHLSPHAGSGQTLPHSGQSSVQNPFNIGGLNPCSFANATAFPHNVPLNVNAASQFLPQFVPQQLPVQNSLDINHCQPLAQMNSTIVVNPNNLTTPFTFNANLTSYLPAYCHAPQSQPTTAPSTAQNQLLPAQATRQAPTQGNSTTPQEKPVKDSGRNSAPRKTETRDDSNRHRDDSRSSSHRNSNNEPNRSNRDQSRDRSSSHRDKSPRKSRDDSRDQRDHREDSRGQRNRDESKDHRSQDSSNNRSDSHNRKRALSPSPVRYNIDFSKNFTYETFLGTGISTNSKKSLSSSRDVSSRRPANDNSDQQEFDFVELKSKINQFNWTTSGALPSNMRRLNVTSTPAFKYYVPSEDGRTLANCGVTETMRELQSAFQCFIQGLARDQLCMTSSSRARDLNNITNRLNNHMLRLGVDIPEKKTTNNRKTVCAMLKQLKINITEMESSSTDYDISLSSNIDRLLSPEKSGESLPGEAYHSKASRNRKRMKNHRAELSKMSKAVLKNRIDDFIERTSVDDDLIAEKLKMDYVSLQKSDPYRLHKDIYPNEKDFHCHKPACTCLGDNKLTGPHHGVFYGETTYEKCEPLCNNLQKLHHYYINMKPSHHFTLEDPTAILYENVTYSFGGFSLFAHEELNNIPAARFTKGQTQYTLELVKEPPPSSFSVRDCDMLSDFIFNNLLEFFDFDLTDKEGCRRFHLFPRFERKMPDSGIEILSAHVLLKHILSSFAPLFDKQKCSDLQILSSGQLSNVATSLKDHLVLFPGKKPLCVRVDNVSFPDPTRKKVPSIVHTTLLPSSLSFLGDKKFLNLKKLHAKIRETMQFRNDPKDSDILAELDKMMDDHKKSKRATVYCELPSENCYFSGFKCDITHCAVFIPRVIFQIRRHLGLQKLCAKFEYTIKNPLHFEVAFTHSTGPENVLDGTNKSHVKNSRYRVGKNMNDVPINERLDVHNNGGGTRVKAAKHKRNLFTMIQTMQKLPLTEQDIVDYPTTDNYERIEFLGDAVLEMIVSTHLFFMLPEAKEGILSLFRIPLVANTYLSKISKRAGLTKHLIISHDAYFNLPGPRDKIHADILEAFLGAVFLDSDLTETDRIFSRMFFPVVKDREMWCNLQPHEFQQEYPNGDRHLIENNPVLQKLVALEESLGLKFNHIQLLARSLTSSSLSYNFLTGGSNERLEFLGDTVMKLLVTNFIYKHFPVYHENHLSTLRGTLVSRFTQEEVSRELGLTDYTIDKLCIDLTSQSSAGMTTKRKADLFEAFLAAVFIDQGLQTCMIIFRTCIFPKIPKMLMHQRWLTPHMMLHCCLLAIRSVGDFEKSTMLIPSYRILNNKDQSQSSNTSSQSENRNSGGKNNQSGNCKSSNQSGSNNGAHEKRVGVFIGGRMIGSGTGKSLHYAASQACREALALFQSKHPHTLVSLLSSRVDSIVNSGPEGGASRGNEGTSESPKKFPDQAVQGGSSHTVPMKQQRMNPNADNTLNSSSTAGMPSLKDSTAINGDGTANTATNAASGASAVKESNALYKVFSAY